MAAGGSGSNDPNMEAPTNVSTNGDSCMWYAGESCQDSRSCYDCLNVGVVGDTCAVGPYGQCLSISKQRNGTTYYAASSTTYCESSDAVCTACRDKWLEEHANNGDMTSSSECVGYDGCVCIAACERNSRNSIVLQEECPLQEDTHVGTIMLVLAGVIAAVILFSIVTFCLKTFILHGMELRLANSSTELPRRRQRSPRGPQLSLSGWKSMREGLIETEHAPTAGPSGVMRVQLSTTEATSVTIEEGDGFRPASPSDSRR